MSSSEAKTRGPLPTLAWTAPRRRWERTATSTKVARLRERRRASRQASVTKLAELPAMRLAASQKRQALSRARVNLPRRPPDDEVCPDLRVFLDDCFLAGPTGNNRSQMSCEQSFEKFFELLNQFNFD